MSDQLTTIRSFIDKHVRGFDVADEDDLFESGYVNSLFAVQIVMFVEDKLGVSVIGDDLDIKNFASITKIDRFVTEKKATAEV